MSCQKGFPAWPVRSAPPIQSLPVSSLTPSLGDVAVTYTFKLSRRLARLRGPACVAAVLALVGCSDSDAFAPGHDAGDTPSTPTPALGTAFAGGIPIGMFDQPLSDFGGRYNGAQLTISPNLLVDELAAIKSRGGKIVLMMAGSQPNYLNKDGTFNLSMWKERVDRFRSINFNSYITDGTIIAHYLIDEPYDTANFGGKAIPGSAIDEMARYSKSIWPNLPTVARAEPYLIQWENPYRYLDAAWAQYLARKGDPYAYIKKNVSVAQQMGLGLIVGLNLQHGGVPNMSAMSPSEVESFGTALLSTNYPCAFISWTYEDKFLATAGMGAAMDALRAKAENRASPSCMLGGTTEPPPTEEPPPPPPPTEEPPPPPPPAPTSALPFGLAYAPASEDAGNWNSSVFKATPSSLVYRLNTAATSQIKLVVMLASMPQVKNSDGTFNLSKWKTEVDKFRGLAVGTYIANGTYYLHYLVDQPNCASCWGGTAIPWATVEEMARYSKSIWPGLATVARVAPSDLAKATFQWTYLDAGWFQYDTRMGDIRTYLANQVAQAKNEGLGLVAGLYVKHAAGMGTAPMTASQIKSLGTVIASDPYVCAATGWKYDATYLAQTGIRAAFDSVASVARTRTAGSCVAH
jgi:hypothetical protein